MGKLGVGEGAYRRRLVYHDPVGTGCCIEGEVDILVDNVEKRGCVTLGKGGIVEVVSRCKEEG